MDIKLFDYAQRPAPYAPSTARFWDDEHISAGMLAAHTHPTGEGATRNHAFVRRSAKWMAGVLPPAQYPLLLDLGCGPGIYAEQFCDAGFAVTGMDLSARSVAYAQGQARRKKLPIAYVQGSYLEMEYTGAFDAATLIYCDYGALPPEDRHTLLRRTRAALRPGGKLLLDVFTPAHFAKTPEHTTWEVCDGGFWAAEPYLRLYAFLRYEAERLFLERHIVETEGGTECYNLWNQTFTPGTLAAELRAAGFGNLQLYGDVAGAPLAEERPTLCAVCVKQETH